MKTNMTSFKAGFFALALMGVALFGISGAKAQIIAPAPNIYACTAIPYNLSLGMYDTAQVTALQSYLNARGYMSHIPTGYFGPLTYQAVVSFQSSYGIPATGFVGPITRGQIQSLTCGGNPPPVSSVSILSINPSTAAVGTQISILGTGFSATDNTVYIGGGAMQHLPATTIYNLSAGSGSIVCNGYPNCTAPEQTITFTLPDAVGTYCAPGMMCAMIARLITPGTYPISVMNANGTSNTVNLTVVSNNASSQISILGIDAPNTLPINTPGNWTIHAMAGGSTNLHYSVAWGDYLPVSGTIMAAPQAGVQSSATFTHAYAQAGTYHPSFTVTDDAGHSATTSASIVVTPLY